MKVQVELDHSAVDHAVTCREQAEGFRSSVAELRSLAVVLGLSDHDSTPTTITIAALLTSLNKLIAIQTEAAGGLDAMAESCDEIVAQRMTESWEELPHPIAIWALDFVHTALLGVGIVTLIFVGYIKIQKMRSGAETKVVQLMAIPPMGGINGSR